MIFVLDILDSAQVSVEDDEVTLPEANHETLVGMWAMPKFLSMFPDFPFEESISVVNYEPDAGIYHIRHGDEVTVYERPNQHPYFAWVEKNQQKLIDMAKRYRIAEIQRDWKTLADYV